MSTVVRLQPPVVNLALYKGDGATIRLAVDNVMGAVIPLTGPVTAQIRVSRADPTVLQSFSVDLTGAASGVALLGLTAAQTNALASAGDFIGVWDVQYTASGAEPLTLAQGKATVKQDVTH